eukprot:5358329-Prymnesium_polylepis.1
MIGGSGRLGRGMGQGTPLFTRHPAPLGSPRAAVTGGEYHGLVAWLRAQGLGEIEDQLMRVKLLGDKKFQLTKFLKEHFPHGAVAAVAD